MLRAFRRTSMRKRFATDGKLKRGVKALVCHSIRFNVVNGRLFIDYRDWRKYDRLCNLRRLPKTRC